MLHSNDLGDSYGQGYVHENERIKRLPPLRILSLDGGGVRGYSMLIILQELMHRTFVAHYGRAPKRTEIPKPCEHFDLIVGMGTGGLIAIMLGRLRLDIETCKNVYVRMTKRVFETDKTFAGIPYGATLFKASRLEEAIRECVAHHTIRGDEGNDNSDLEDELSGNRISSVPTTSYSSYNCTSRNSESRQSNVVNDQSSNCSSDTPPPLRSRSNASYYSQLGKVYEVNCEVTRAGKSCNSSGHGNPNALLYDRRKRHTKTAVTAVFKGIQSEGKTVLLRSYDSRVEAAPEFNCTIWQAGRATSATSPAFKAIQIGQSVFLDEGAGQYNPTPLAVEEAVCNEWPGREVGIIVSIGTGRTTNRGMGGNSGNSHWRLEDILMNDTIQLSEAVSGLIDARRRLLRKIDECERVHESMLKRHLRERNISAEKYYRFNVHVYNKDQDIKNHGNQRNGGETGFGGVNEWQRLAEISTLTRVYLKRKEVQDKTGRASEKLGELYGENMKLKYGESGDKRLSMYKYEPMPVELPGDDPTTTVNHLLVPNRMHREETVSLIHASCITKTQMSPRGSEIKRERGGVQNKMEDSVHGEYNRCKNCSGSRSQIVTQPCPTLCKEEKDSPVIDVGIGETGVESGKKMSIAKPVSSPPLPLPPPPPPNYPAPVPFSGWNNKNEECREWERRGSLKAKQTSFPPYPDTDEPPDVSRWKMN